MLISVISFFFSSSSSYDCIYSGIPKERYEGAAAGQWSRSCTEPFFSQSVANFLLFTVPTSTG